MAFYGQVVHQKYKIVAVGAYSAALHHEVLALIEAEQLGKVISHKLAFVGKHNLLATISQLLVMPLKYGQVVDEKSLAQRGELLAQGGKLFVEG